MYINIFILIIVLTITTLFTWKKKEYKSIFYNVGFIFILWIYTPCFFNASSINIDSSWIMLPFRLSSKWGIIYTILANIILGVILVLQERISNSATCTYNEIKKMYDDFSEDAEELYIIGKDVDFLFKKGFEKQTNRITHLGSKCMLLCESTEDPELLKLYKKIQEKGVKVRAYKESGNVTKLKGQIKVDQSGLKRAVFTYRNNDKTYSLVNIENQFLVSTILERWIDVYEKSYILR